MLTRLALSRQYLRLDESKRLAWEQDRGRMLLILRAVTRRLTRLTHDLRRAYRSKPLEWIQAKFDARLAEFREQGPWIADQMRPHEAVLGCVLEFGEMRTALRACVELIEKVKA